jgi:3-phytase
MKILTHAKILAGAASLLLASHIAAVADVYVLDNTAPQYLLYTDPVTGNEIRFGGLSGLYPVPGDSSGTLFYSITDRGPNGDIGTFKAFPVPSFTPTIVKLRLNATGVAEILQLIPLRKPNGQPITGLPNRCLANSEVGMDLNYNVLPDDPDGLDTEGLTMDDQGNFWISDEYRASISMVSPDGTVQFRLVPANSCPGLHVPTYGVLPEVYKLRRVNRGMESITYANGRIYGAMQRPLDNPNRTIGGNSQMIRIIEITVANLFAPANGPVVRQFVYVTEPNSSQANVYASDMFALNPALFLVSERRTDKVFAINIPSANDITPLEDSLGKLLAAPTRTLESLKPNELADFGIQPVKKAVVVHSMIALHPALEKSEGLAVSGHNIVLAGDNDFNLLAVNSTTTPASIELISPINPPVVVTTPLPDEIVFEDEKPKHEDKD